MRDGVEIGGTGPRRPPIALWATLVVDALTVGYLGIVLAGATYAIARRATARKSEAMIA